MQEIDYMDGQNLAGVAFTLPLQDGALVGPLPAFFSVQSIFYSITGFDASLLHQRRILLLPFQQQRLADAHQVENLHLCGIQDGLAFILIRQHARQGDGADQ